MLEEVISIVRQASELMLSKDFKIEQKTNLTNIVTSSDVAVQHFLCKHLAELVPGSGFICEEEDFVIKGCEYCWVIDPIDGTANYSRGIIECCISVALMHKGEIVLGVVFSPGRGELYCAEKGQGAWCNSKPLKSSDRTFEQGILCTAMSTYRKEYAATCSDIIMEAFYQCNDVRRFGSAALEMCYLAAGQIDLYFEMRLQPWDYAAGQLIAEEAGASMGSFDGPLTYDRPNLVIGANSAGNLERLRGIVHNHMDAIPYTD